MVVKKLDDFVHSGFGRKPFPLTLTNLIGITATFGDEILYIEHRECSGNTHLKNKSTYGFSSLNYLG